jgi:nucleotide-binding universal stress UspA family protein
VTDKEELIMTILVAVPESLEGRVALQAAATEAKTHQTDLVVLNLGLSKIAPTTLPRDVATTVVDRSGPADHDPADVVLDYLASHPGISRLVIGVKRRTPVGKVVFGSVSQRLLLESPVPVLAVKPA